METNILKEITAKAAEHGYNVRIRDISYALLRVKFGDAKAAYSVVFDPAADDEDVKAYEDGAAITYLIGYFRRSESQPQQKADDTSKILEALKSNGAAKNENDITAEENKAAMVELIERTETALNEGAIDVDKGLKIIADLRVKLNDKFGVGEEQDRKNIIILPKTYDLICPHTHHECYQMDKEYAMEHFNLIERN
jgi:hypothetical protein